MGDIKSYQVRIESKGKAGTITLKGESPTQIRDWFRRVSGKTKIKGLRKPVFFPKSARIVSIKPRKVTVRRRRPYSSLGSFRF